MQSFVTTVEIYLYEGLDDNDRWQEVLRSLAEQRHQEVQSSLSELDDLGADALRLSTFLSDCLLGTYTGDNPQLSTLADCTRYIFSSVADDLATEPHSPNYRRISVRAAYGRFQAHLQSLADRDDLSEEELQLATFLTECLHQGRATDKLKRMAA